VTRVLKVPERAWSSRSQMPNLTFAAPTAAADPREPPRCLSGPPTTACNAHTPADSGMITRSHSAVVASAGSCSHPPGGASARPEPARLRHAARRLHCRSRPPNRIASGFAHRSFRPDVVRHKSVTTAAHRPTVTHADTCRDREETARRAAFPQPRGRFRRWWQVLGSNQRRLSRRFYSTLLPAPPYAISPAQT
jgi:hypothetical protein